MLLVALAMFGVFFFVSLYMQNVLGYSAVQAGAAFLPMTMLIILVAPMAGRLSDRSGSRWLMTGGMVAARRALALLSRSSASTRPSGRSCRRCSRRRRHGADDDADRGRGDERGAASTRRASARPC